MLIYMKKFDSSDPNWGIMFVGAHRNKLDLSKATKDNPKEVGDEFGAELVLNFPEMYGMVKVIIPEAEKIIDEEKLDHNNTILAEITVENPVEETAKPDYSKMNKSQLWKEVKESGSPFTLKWNKSSKEEMLEWLNDL